MLIYFVRHPTNTINDVFLGVFGKVGIDVNDRATEIQIKIELSWEQSPAKILNALFLRHRFKHWKSLSALTEKLLDHFIFFVGISCDNVNFFCIPYSS